MSATKTLDVARSEDRIVVTLDDPARGNALGQEMIDELHAVLDYVECTLRDVLNWKVGSHLPLNALPDRRNLPGSDRLIRGYHARKRHRQAP